MEINSLLGHYVPIEENWLGLIEGDDKTMIKLRSASMWYDEYIKIMAKFDGDDKKDSFKTISGNRSIAKAKAKKEDDSLTKVEKEQKEKEQEAKIVQEMRDFIIDYVIADWKGIEENGVALPFTRENALKLFDLNNPGTKNIVLRIMTAAADGSNFTKNAEYLIEDENTVKK